MRKPVRKPARKPTRASRTLRQPTTASQPWSQEVDALELLEESEQERRWARSEQFDREYFSIQPADW